MPTSRLETVLAAFKTQLATINSVAPGSTVTVARSLDDAIAQGSLPTVVMTKGALLKNDGAVGGEITGQDRYLINIAVWCYEGAATDELLDAALSDIYARVVKTMLANVTLSGAAEYLREAPNAADAPEWDHERGRRPNAALTVFFETEFITKQGDPFSLPS